MNGDMSTPFWTYSNRTKYAIENGIKYGNE